MHDLKHTPYLIKQFEEERQDRDFENMTQARPAPRTVRITAWGAFLLVAIMAALWLYTFGYARGWQQGLEDRSSNYWPADDSPAAFSEDY